MPVRTFDDAAYQAVKTSLPIPRGIALQYDPRGVRSPGVASVRAALTVPTGPVPNWTVQDVPQLPGWFELTPPADQTISLGELWDTIRALRRRRDVRNADPLFLVANPEPAGPVEREAFALGYGQQQFGLWGWPYDPDTIAAIEKARQDSRWHLDQMKVGDAWNIWHARHAVGTPGEGILVGHPDTGYSDHLELTGRLELPGTSFLLDANGQQVPDARDDLLRDNTALIENPGHGTSTASVIASGEDDEQGTGGIEVYGVAPGARVLPLRVSRSVIHFDFSNVAHAILYAVDRNADVISMSLGGPTYSAFVRAAIDHALDEGLIVVAAAGNNVPATVFPAALPEVIAAAATNAVAGTWRFSGIGRLVDIAAPGEDVWCARAELANGAPSFSVGMGTGTSFATACIAGLAALWLSYHGGREAIARDQYAGRKGLVPFAFQYLLAQTADKDHDFVAEGKYGAGIANAAALLEASLPSLETVERFEQVIRKQPVNRLTFISGLFSGGLGITDRPAVTLTVEATAPARGLVPKGPPEETDAFKRAAAEQAAERKLLEDLLGSQATALGDELLARIGADRLLLVGFQRWRQGESLLPLLDRLLPRSTDRTGPDRTAAEPVTPDLSAPLAQLLRKRRSDERKRLETIHRGKLYPGVSIDIVPPTSTPGTPAPPGPPTPDARRLRAYAFDPSLATKLDTAPIHQVTIPTRWEHVKPGPIGEYLEVVDVDPSSGCAYSPVDLNHPHVLAQDGLPPSEGDPQFHQQMVYAVAMNTIHRFEMALGRPIFWSPLRPWLLECPEERNHFTAEALEVQKKIRKAVNLPDPPVPSRDPEVQRKERTIQRQDRYVQRLRIYPHALREANAFYSPTKRALLFGYFPGSDDDTGRHFPGGLVFTCLSHDIVAHETTHALLDGMHPYFNEPTNHDVWAFHEAFADIMAIFQHFTYPDVLCQQIANTRGDLETNSLLAQLAQQFGEATGNRGALRNALGAENDKGEWTRSKPDARALHGVDEPHKRGSILIAAVFDAFLSLYNDRVADLLRIYTGGTGVLPAGQIHPDLVSRLASEAASTAEEVLRVCIRALDYVPPVDITFGEFLRALITADYDLSAGVRRRNRVAFIDAFRSWGIYPRDVPTLSEESLRWRAPEPDATLNRLTQLGRSDNRYFDTRYGRTLKRLASVLEGWQPGRDRAEVFREILLAQGVLHDLLAELQANVRDGRELIPGLDLRPGAGFSISNLRPARRVGLRGEFRTELVVEVVQTYRPPAKDPTTAASGASTATADGASDGLSDAIPDDAGPFRGGATLIVDLATWEIRYIIYKRLYDRLPAKPGGPATLASRFNQPRPRLADGEHAAWQGEDARSMADWLSKTYDCQDRLAKRKTRAAREEPFALLHRETF